MVDLMRFWKLQSVKKREILFISTKMHAKIEAVYERLSEAKIVIKAIDMQ